MASLLPLSVAVLTHVYTPEAYKQKRTPPTPPTPPTYSSLCCLLLLHSEALLLTSLFCGFVRSVLVRISARRQRSVVVSTHPLHMLLCFFTLHHVQAAEGTPLCAKFPFPHTHHGRYLQHSTNTSTTHPSKKMAFLLALLATQSAASTAPLPPGVDVLSEVTTGFNINASNTTINVDAGLVSLVSGIADTQTTYLQRVVLNLTAPAGVDKILPFNLTLFTDDKMGQLMTVDPTNDTVLTVAIGSEYAPAADMYFLVSAPVWTDPNPVFSYSMRVFTRYVPKSGPAGVNLELSEAAIDNAVSPLKPVSAGSNGSVTMGSKLTDFYMGVMHCGASEAVHFTVTAGEADAISSNVVYTAGSAAQGTVTFVSQCEKGKILLITGQPGSSFSWFATSDSGSNSLSVYAIAGIAVGCLVVVAAVVCGALCLSKSKRNNDELMSLNK